MLAYAISTKREPLEPRETKKPNKYLIRGWKKDWIGWFTVLSPRQIGPDWEERSRGGFKLKPRSVFEIFGSEGGRICGIYEILAMKKKKEFVVYVGCSCRSCGKSLPERINEYCADGSHKADLIDDALKKGYTLSFRYKVARNKEEAENYENQLLAKYSYGWNVRTVTGTLPD